MRFKLRVIRALPFVQIRVPGKWHTHTRFLSLIFRMQSHDHQSHEHHPAPHPSVFRLATQATLHCLLGCGLGEVVGMIISAVLHLGNGASIVISLVMGFVGGLALGIVPLKKAGYPMGKAVRTVLIGEGLSIAVMETFEVLTAIAIPGVMAAHLDEPIFWLGMLAGLVVGFIAAWPVNYVLIKRGARHHH